MRKKQVTYLIIILTLIVLSTFRLQIYWNYQNFENSKIATKEEIKTSIPLYKSTTVEVEAIK